MIRLEKLHGFHLDLVNGHWFHLPSNYYKLNVDDSVRDEIAPMEVCYGIMQGNGRCGDLLGGLPIPLLHIRSF